MWKEIATQVQEAQTVPYRIKPRRNTQSHILIKLTKIKHKEKILKHQGKAMNNIQGCPYKAIVDLLIETLYGIREWQDILKVMKGKTLQPRLLYPARVPFRFREIKSFIDSQK